MKKFLFALFIGFSAINAFACTPGAGNGPAGDPNCMGAILSTDPYYNQGQSGGSQSRPKKIIRYTEVKVPSKYGALAYDSKTGTLGDAINANSLAEAKKAAVAQCAQGGKNKNCKVVTWVKNGCFAAADGKLKNKSFIYRAAEEQGKAESVALKRCKASGASDCKIIVPEGCSIPDISKY